MYQMLIKIRLVIMQLSTLDNVFMKMVTKFYVSETFFMLRSIFTIYMLWDD